MYYDRKNKENKGNTVRVRGDREMIWTHDERVSGHPVPDDHAVERHPKVHPYKILDYRYHASMHGSQRALTQHGVLRRRVDRDNASAKLPKVYADISYGGRRAPTISSNRTMFKQHNKVLRWVKRKILDPYTQVVHNKTLLATTVPRQR
jgi:hypothetical protein